MEGRHLRRTAAGSQSLLGTHSICSMPAPVLGRAGPKGLRLKDWICGQAEDRTGRGSWGGASCHTPARKPSTAVWGLCLEMGVGKGRDSRPPTFPSLNSPKAGQAATLSHAQVSSLDVFILSLPDCLTAPSVPPPVSGCEAALVLSPQLFPRLQGDLGQTHPGWNPR